MDHLLEGRPSQGFKRRQAFILAIVTYFVYKRYSLNATSLPKLFSRIDRFFHQFAPWQIVLITLFSHYMLRNALTLLYLSGPDSKLTGYSPSFHRAALVFKALDAGFWSTMRIWPNALRQIMSILFTAYFLLSPEHAEEVTKRFRAQVNIKLIRYSWEKSNHPFLKLLTNITNPKINLKIPFKIPRYVDGHIACSLPVIDGLNTFVEGVIYFDGTREELAVQKKLLFHVPGGGFVAMSPENHDESLSRIAKKIKIPIFTINYKKAPEYPYPHALNEIFDAYSVIFLTKGKVLGINSMGDNEDLLTMVMMGDSAGGNLITSVLLKILIECEYCRVPSAMVLVYPFLNFDVQGWIHHDYRSIIARNGDLSTPETIEEESDDVGIPSINVDNVIRNASNATTFTSRLRFFNDSIVPPEFLFEMGKLYVGNHRLNDINPARDLYLSPMYASDDLLALFPPCYIQAGDKDPMIDDAIIFSARLYKLFCNKESKEGTKYALNDPTLVTDLPYPYVQLSVIEGFSHGYLQMLGFLPEAKKYLEEICDFLILAFNSPDRYQPPPRVSLRTWQLLKGSSSRKNSMDDPFNNNPMVLPIGARNKNSKRKIAAQQQDSPDEVFRVRSETHIYSSWKEPQ